MRYELEPLRSPNPQLVNFFEHRSAAAADHGGAIAADQRVGHFLTASGAVERFALSFFDFTHNFTRAQQAECTRARSGGQDYSLLGGIVAMISPRNARRAAWTSSSFPVKK